MIQVSGLFNALLCTAGNFNGLVRFTFYLRNKNLPLFELHQLNYNVVAICYSLPIVNILRGFVGIFRTLLEKYFENEVFKKEEHPIK